MTVSNMFFCLFCFVFLFFSSQNSSKSKSILSENKNIIVKAYFTQNVGSGGNFEGGKHDSGL